jgi:hypothetical protein
MTLWFWVRLAIIVSAAASAGLAPVKPFGLPGGWYAVAITFIFFVLAPTIVVPMQSLNRWSAPIWHRPSWNVNPFSPREPFQFIHLCAWTLLAQGVVYLGRLAISSVSVYPEALMPLAIGIGGLLGLRLSMIAFSTRWLAAPNNRWRGP